MPVEMERKLKAEAKKKGLKGKRKDAYIFGTMRSKTDWEPSHQKKNGPPKKGKPKAKCD